MSNSHPGTNTEASHVLLNERQHSLLAHWRAWWEEEEDRFLHWEVRDRDAETVASFNLILKTSGLADGRDLTMAQLDRLCALARRIVPNRNLDRRLYSRPDDPHAFSRLLRNLLYGDEPLPHRLAEFMSLKGVGGQTVSQWLCMSNPASYPLITPSTLAVVSSLELADEQQATVSGAAHEGHGLTEAIGNGAASRIVSQFHVHKVLREELGCEDYLELYRILLNAHEREGSAIASLPAVAREDRASYAASRRAARSYAPTATTERELLTALEAHVESAGFIYPPLTLRNYYVALKTKPFAILSGISGTGKTRLTHLLAEFLTGDTAAQYRLIPVRPDWTDSTSLLGYTNVLAGPDGRYVSTPFLDLLREAGRSENRSKAYFVCLDEMNLARVEYYLADFLSGMEAADKSLHLQGPNGALTIRIPPNFFLTGTVNVDETTHPFSRKVLDRANTIEVGTADIRHFPPRVDRPVQDVLERSRSLSLFLTRRAGSVVEAAARLGSFSPGLAERAVDVLARLNDAMRQSDIAFGYRVRDEVLLYLANSFDEAGRGLLEEDPHKNGLIALDFQLLQKALPRLSGTREQIELAVRSALTLLLPDKDSLLRDVKGNAETLLRMSNQAEFPRSAGKLVSLLMRLQRDGFVTFYEG